MCSNCVFLSAAATGVFWDMDECRKECEIPEELTAADVVPRIRQKLLDLGLRGPVSIRIYGDLTGLDYLDFQSSEDVKLHHFHAGEKREKMTKILEGIVSWSGENPEPSVGILVLGHLGAADDADITEVIELLKTQKNYQFMLVTPESPPPPTVVGFLRAIPRGGL
uniref:NYN domain-containing protein n=1 Tax=Brassica oleracea TaxID=3712 RepID=A0A3P6DQ68_BRAOL|nr:unnamed protein product [Brassica oleracea]